MDDASPSIDRGSVSPPGRQRTPSEWLLILVTIFLTATVVAAGAYFLFLRLHEGRIYPNVRIGADNLGGLTREEARTILAKKAAAIQENGIAFHLLNEQLNIAATVDSTDADLSLEILSYDLDRTIAAAYDHGRGPDLIGNLIDQWNAVIGGVTLPAAVKLNAEEAEKILTANFGNKVDPAKNAELVFLGGRFFVTEETTGQAIGIKDGVDLFRQRLAALDNTPINLAIATVTPTITKAQAAGMEAQASATAALAPIKLDHDGRAWSVNRAGLSNWLGLKREEGRLVIGLKPEKIDLFLLDRVAPDIDQPAEEPRFNIVDGRVTEWGVGRNGIELDVRASAQAIERALSDGTTTVALVVRELPYKTTADNIDTRGINEVVGTGESNFAGSPKNRRHNIKTGADKLHGLLIEPGQEFSLIKALGEIEASTGFLPELVIKGNKTVPEYGGGLCQIGTTMFRAALASGLPITMRRNHSYRVSYYEPAGTDATIYDPLPDFRFKNDMPNYLLIQARLEGDEIFFDFWGTPDGRVATRTAPTIYNLVKPGPAKLIETLDLKPGEKKCSEKPHSGADAYFDYKVIYPDGETKEARFKSHYIPWREVCLIGVERLSVTATSTPGTTPTDP